VGKSILLLQQYLEELIDDAMDLLNRLLAERKTKGMARVASSIHIPLVGAGRRLRYIGAADVNVWIFVRI
jgi:hypothetical protein